MRAETKRQRRFPHRCQREREREKHRRKQQKEAGREHVVQKRKKFVEDHHDDCGEDMSSLNNDNMPEDSLLVEGDTDSELSDIDHEAQLRMTGYCQSCYPIDITKVARYQPGQYPAGRGVRDHRAPPNKDSPCPGCRHNRSRVDWEHNRVIGQCAYPHDDPWIPECRVCQDRLPRAA